MAPPEGVDQCVCGGVAGPASQGRAQAVSPPRGGVEWGSPLTFRIDPIGIIAGDLFFAGLIL